VSRHSSGPRSPVRSDARRDPLWEFAAVPARSPAALAREQPDLEELERIFVAIVFGMTNACSGTHESNRHLESVVRSAPVNADCRGPVAAGRRSARSIANPMNFRRRTRPLPIGTRPSDRQHSGSGYV